jgi:GTPase SAR1 family protein
MNVILVGNKSDKEDQREVTLEEGQEFANKNELYFIETSAKDSINVENAFLHVAQEIVNQIETQKIDVSKENLGIKVGAEYNKSIEELRGDHQSQELKPIDLSKESRKLCC